MSGELVDSYYKRNRDSILKKSKEYRNKNKNKINRLRKVWREKNKEKLKLRDRVYRFKNHSKKLESDRLYRLSHKEQIAGYKKKWGKQNRGRLSLKAKKYRLENPELIKKQDKEQYLKHRDKSKVRQKEYYIKNKETISKKKNVYEKKRYHTDLSYNLKMKLHKRLQSAFKAYSKNGKVGRANKYGINYKKIIEYLGDCPGPREQYQIDHIIPLSFFNFDNPEEVKQAFAPGNHQWLTVEENKRKGSKLEVFDAACNLFN